MTAITATPLQPIHSLEDVVRCKMRTFNIFKVGGDGVRDWVQAVSTLDTAKKRVRELADSWPGEYIISEQSSDNDSSRDPKLNSPNRGAF